MSLLHTPEGRFAKLPDFPYEPNFVDLEDARMAYVDVSSGEETFLCLHGVPTWSYLYRKMIPILAQRGRVVVPDFIGFGRSSKYDSMDAYDFDLHADALTRLIEALDLTEVTLVGQDWGGAHGLHVATVRCPDRFARLVPMNTVGNTLPDEEGKFNSSEEFGVWQKFVESRPDLPIAEIVRNNLRIGELNAESTNEHPQLDLSPPEMDAYRAPFPDERYKAGARKWPLMVPTNSDDDGGWQMLATRNALASWKKPAFVLFSDSDPITHDARDLLRRLIPTATEQPNVWIEGAGHFLQESDGQRVAEHILEFVDRTPLQG